MIAIVESYIRELRRRLGIRPLKETVRAQTGSGSGGFARVARLDDPDEPVSCRRDRSSREAHSASLRTKGFSDKPE
jgi:hypothetical protein